MEAGVDTKMGDNYALTAYVVVALKEAGYGRVTRKLKLKTVSSD